MGRLRPVRGRAADAVGGVAREPAAISRSSSSSSWERGQSAGREHDTDWRRLQLERAELARNARVDEAARGQLKMIPIVPDRTIYLNQAPVVQGGAQ